MKVSIETIKVKFNDAEMSTQLDVTISADDLNNSCILRYSLLDSTGAATMTGYETISGEDYTSWTGDNTYPITYIANKLNLQVL